MILPFRGVLPRVDPAAWVAENAVIIGDVEVGPESTIWYGCVLRGDVHPIRVGRGSNIQDGSVLHVEGGLYACVVKDRVSVGHGVILHGCTVEEGALVGMGATVLNAALVGREAAVGAGAVVTEGTKIPPRTLWLGVPARQVRELTEEELRRFADTATHYAELQAHYRKP